MEIRIAEEKLARLRRTGGSTSAVRRMGAAQFGQSSALRIVSPGEHLISAARSAGSPEPGDKVTIAGTCLPYEVVSTDFGAIPQLFRRGCFQKSLQVEPDIRVTFNFDSGRILGRTSAGTASAWEDHQGLQFEANPPSVPWADDLLVSIKRRDISGSAISFMPVIQGWELRNGQKIRVIEQADLIAIAVSSFPQFDSGLAVNKSDAIAASAYDRRFLKSAGIQAGRV